MKIVVYGNSIAACMSTLALNKYVGSEIDLTLVLPPEQSSSDVLFSGMTSPNAYDFHLWLGLTEPELLLGSNSSFSFGAHYCDWTEEKLDWVQAFSLPFPTNYGVDFHQVLNKYGEDLQDYILGATAAKHSRFAHPPENQPNNPLSRAEYGYHFDANSYASTLLEQVKRANINLVQGRITDADITNNADKNAIDTPNIRSITLDINGKKVEEVIAADLFIDCSGSQRALFSLLRNHLGDSSNRHFRTESTFVASKREYSPQNAAQSAIESTSCAKIQGVREHFVVSTPLQSSIQELTFSLQTDEKENDIDGAKVTFNTGALSEAWVGNCVCISHAAAVLSPHTNAPYRLLKLDIERLLELIPVESNLSMERKEFNRRFELDVIHAKLFSEALFDTRSALGETKPSSRDTDIHQISSNDVDDLLNRKIEQYLNRGFIVSYDYEPFNTEDWKILHSGMRRKPRRYDALCDGLDDATTRQKLAEIKNGIQVLVPKMPPCHIYTQKFKDYLLKKQ